MALAWKTRRRLALAVLVVGVPAYVVLAVTLLDRLGRPPFLAELALHAGLGVLWALPLRVLFRGIARPPPPAPPRG
ncbi:MAG: DUF2842 domain-containing protein [Rhodobacteraceae bacterium]|nr:DUF2842 domain-containing protein [Paracoccaceae bacterium]